MSDGGRRALGMTFAVLAVLSSLFAGLAWHTRKVIYNQATFVSTVDEIIGDRGVQDTVTDLVVDEVFLAAGLERPEEVEEEEEEDAQPSSLAELREEAGIEEEEPAEDDATPQPTIEQVIETKTADTTRSLLQSGALDQQMLLAITDVHEELIKVLDEDPEVVVRDEGRVIVDIGPVVDSVVTRLSADPITSFLADTSFSADTGRYIVVRDSDGVNIVWTMVRSFDGTATLLVVLTLLFSIGAVAIYPERDRILMGMGIAIAAIAIGILVVVWTAGIISRGLLIDDPETRNIFRASYNALTSPLYRQEIIVAIIGVCMIIVGFVLGEVLRRINNADYEAYYDPYALEDDPYYWNEY